MLENNNRLPFTRTPNTKTLVLKVYRPKGSASLLAPRSTDSESRNRVQQSVFIHHPGLENSNTC